MTPLPSDFDHVTYRRDLYKQPLTYWQEALDTIAAAHNLPTEAWSRASLGRNVVFLSPTTVIKLGPPYGRDEIEREVAALKFVAGQLPVQTPTYVASGTLDGWGYLVQERVAGTNLHSLWKHLDDQAKSALAHQHGALMAALHSLSLDDVPRVLDFNWDGMLGEQRECCASDMAADGVNPALVAQVDSYLDATPWEIEQGKEVLLHGDLCYLNFLVTEVQGAWQITGLLDWGDVKIGPPSHEYISPNMNWYRGDIAVLRHWHQGYTLLNRDEVVALQHVIMARSMLYYSDSFAKLIAHIPGADACTTWPALASHYLQMER